MTRTSAIVLAIVVLAGVGQVMTTLTPKPPEPTPDQRAAKAKEEIEDNDALLMARVAVSALRSSLNDPDSLKVVSIAYRRPPKAICIEFRAKNGFAGVIRSAATFVDLKLRTNSVAVWNKYCAGDGFHDIPSWAAGG